MNMNINEAWNNETVIQFDDAGASPGKAGGNRNNTPLVNGDIQGLEAPVAKDGPAGQQYTHRRSPLHFTQGVIISEKTSVVNGPREKFFLLRPPLSSRRVFFAELKTFKI